MNNGYYEKAFWQSKKWWDMILGVGVVVAVFALDLPKEVLIALAPILGHQLSQGLADFGKEDKARTEVVSNLEEEIEDYDKRLEVMFDQRDLLEFEILRIASDTIPVVPEKTPADYEREYLAYFEERIDYYKGKLAMFPDRRFRFDELLKTAEHSLVVAKASVASVKAGRSEPYSLGAIGYYIIGKKPPWEM